MKFKFLVLMPLLSLSVSSFASSVNHAKFNFDCINKNARPLQKTLSLNVTITTFNSGKKITSATVETRRDIFDMSLVKGDATSLETDTFYVDVAGTELEASYNLKLSAPINEQLNSFDASWKFLVNNQEVSLGEGFSNPEQFSCAVAAPKENSVSESLKKAANEYLKGLGDEWRVEGKAMSQYDFSKGFLGKEKRRMERTGDYSLEGHRVNLKVDDVDVLVFVVLASEEESGSVTVYTNKGEFVSEIESSN